MYSYFQCDARKYLRNMKLNGKDTKPCDYEMTDKFNF